MNKKGMNSPIAVVFKDGQGFYTWKYKNKIDPKEPITSVVDKPNVSPSYAETYCQDKNSRIVGKPNGIEGRIISGNASNELAQIMSRNYSFRKGN